MKTNPAVDQLLKAALFSHGRFDDEFSTWKRNHQKRVAIPCGRGCFACCTMTAFCSLPEGIRISRKLSSEGTLRVEQEARELSAATRHEGNLKDLLKRRRAQGCFCTFLMNGECSVYPGRPLACRALVSTRPSEWCGVDFSTLPPLDRKLYLDSLDAEVVAFPTHYAAYPRLLAQRLEEELLAECRRIAGFSLYGPLTIMTHIGHLLLEGVVPPERERIYDALRAGEMDERLVTDRLPHHERHRGRYRPFDTPPGEGYSNPPITEPDRDHEHRPKKTPPPEHRGRDVGPGGDPP